MPIREDEKNNLNVVGTKKMRIAESKNKGK
jgi:hypothetical protein